MVVGVSQQENLDSGFVLLPVINQLYRQRRPEYKCFTQDESRHIIITSAESNHKCFKCGDIGHIRSVCNTNVDLAATNIKSCNSDSIKFNVPNDHLSLSTISKDSVQSYGCSELNEIQNSCETTVSNQSTYQISHVTVPGVAFPNNSLISEDITCKSEENMLNEPSHDKKSEAVLIDADLSNHPLLCNDILNKFHENISEESNPDVI
ncbi:unnamed protein product [Schistosoma margrebowiei]|uniref:Uncharacterized protein n=1 Tax=Schistosoma margrebowiei TaxID=48269 RepID=A0A183MFE4_9TREM|nr:unnamed protein product [Schistosoma margrebowiei]